jgi:hypothetical protein
MVDLPVILDSSFLSGNMPFELKSSFLPLFGAAGDIAPIAFAGKIL